MNTKATISIDRETDPQLNWFKRHLYRREGSKYVLDRKRFSLLFIAIALVAVLFVSLQPAPSQRYATSDVKEHAIEDITLYQFPELTNGLAEQKTKTTVVRAEKKRNAGPQVIARPKLPIPPASQLPAVLITAASDGPVRARTLQAMSFNGEVSIEAGCVLVGQATSTEERLLIMFNKVIDKDGGIRTIQAQAYDKKDNLVGIAGSKLKSNALKFAGGVGLNFLGSMSEGMQEREGQGGVVVKKSSIKNALLEGTSRTALDQSREVMSDLKNSRVGVRVEEGAEIVVVFEGG